MSNQLALLFHLARRQRHIMIIPEHMKISVNTRNPATSGSSSIMTGGDYTPNLATSGCSSICLICLHSNSQGSQAQNLLKVNKDTVRDYMALFKQLEFFAIDIRDRPKGSDYINYQWQQSFRYVRGK